MAKLLTWFDTGTGNWNNDTSDGLPWMTGVGLDTVVNTYERTRDVRYLNVLEKSYTRYVGRLAHFYDDDGRYLNAWIRAYDVTQDPKYLAEAKRIFTEMTTAWDGTCGGGVWWNKDRQYKNAITNELFMLAAARLHRRSPNGTGAGSYYDWAMRSWTWFNNSGMINSSNLVNDGLNASCQNNNDVTWTYNQGVILGALT
ncbi:MAG: glycoside hydrolase family 76 protein, partial [Actinomycetota bacterium]|nr:glycoside hydrolase family 76 protein [Actinomycetota bacterium]